jgi:hypothetical protein
MLNQCVHTTAGGSHVNKESSPLTEGLLTSPLTIRLAAAIIVELPVETASKSYVQ